MSTARDEIEQGVLEASQELAAEQLGNRFRAVKYRSVTGTGANPDLGIPSQKTSWSIANTISPNPVVIDVKNEYQQQQIGILIQGDLKVKINKSLFTKAQLESYEYQIDEKQYSLINGQALEDAYWWILFLKKV